MISSGDKGQVAPGSGAQDPALAFREKAELPPVAGKPASATHFTPAAKMI